MALAKARAFGIFSKKTFELFGKRSDGGAEFTADPETLPMGDMVRRQVKADRVNVARIGDAGPKARMVDG